MRWQAASELAPRDVVVSLYGPPEYSATRTTGARKYEYSTKGILFWTYEGRITQIIAFQPYVRRSNRMTSDNARTATGDAARRPGKTPASAGVIVAGVGWKDVRVGMKREDLLRALGRPDNDPSSDWLKWAGKHIDCAFHTGSLTVSEVRFNPGFEASLANGVAVGSRDAIVSLYGQPEYAINRGNGAKEYEYSTKGVLFWTCQGRVAQIVVFKPYSRIASTKPTSAPTGGAGEERTPPRSTENSSKASASPSAEATSYLEARNDIKGHIGDQVAWVGKYISSSSVSMSMDGKPSDSHQEYQYALVDEKGNCLLDRSFCFSHPGTKKDAKRTTAAEAADNSPHDNRIRLIRGTIAGSKTIKIPGPRMEWRSIEVPDLKDVVVNAPPKR